MSNQFPACESWCVFACTTADRIYDGMTSAEQLKLRDPFTAPPELNLWRCGCAVERISKESYGMREEMKYHAVETVEDILDNAEYDLDMLLYQYEQMVAEQLPTKVFLHFAELHQVAITASRELERRSQRDIIRRKTTLLTNAQLEETLANTRKTLYAETEEGVPESEANKIDLHEIWLQELKREIVLREPPLGFYYDEEGGKFRKAETLSLAEKELKDYFLDQVHGLERSKNNQHYRYLTEAMSETELYNSLNAHNEEIEHVKKSRPWMLA